MTLNQRNVAANTRKCDVLGPISADSDAWDCFLPSLERKFVLFYT